MGGLGAAPEGSIAGRHKAMDAKFARDEGEASPDEEEPADYDALAAKIAEAGGTIVDDPRALKKSKRGDDKPAGAGSAAASKAAVPATSAAPEEETLELDEHGRPKVKFVAVDPSKVAERRAKTGGAAAAARGGSAVRNATLLSFGGDEDEG
jgi:hypothetical protein